MSNDMVVIFLIISLIIGIISGVFVTNDTITSRIIKHGCGQYSPITGNFEYINRLDSIKE